MRMMRRLPALLVMLPSLAVAQSAPEGWTVRQEGREIAMHPPDLARGQIYVLSVQADVEMGSQAPREFLAGRVAASAPGLGKQVVDGAILERPNGGLVTARTYQRPSGSTVDATFALGKQANGKALLISIVCSPAACRAHNPVATKWLQSPAAANIGKEAAGPPPEQRSRRAVSKRRSEYQTEPGQGISAGEIEAVVVEKTPSGYMSPVLLLKSGEYCSEVDVPPEDMDVPLHMKRNSRSWGKWRRRQGVLEMRDWRGKWTAARSWGARLSTARPDEELSGQFSSGRGSGSTMSLREMAFFPGHRFAVRRSASAAVYAGAGIGGGRTRRGAYRMDGHTIELQYDDGTIEREAFHWASDAKDAAFFNDRYYSKDTD